MTEDNASRLAAKIQELWGYSPSESRAIVIYLLSKGTDPHCGEDDLRVNLEAWESGDCRPWRRLKMKKDHYYQLKEIERHKYLLSQRCGFDVGWEAATHDWVKNHAGPWRDWWERQPESTPPFDSSSLASKG